MLAGIGNNVPLHGIPVNIVSMMDEIQLAANPMIGEASLPDFLIAADDRSKIMGVCTFDQLDRTFDGNVQCWRQKKMNVLRHDDERVQFVAPFATIAIDRLQQEPDVRFDCKQFAAVESRESHEIGSGRGDESSRLQEIPSASRPRRV